MIINSPYITGSLTIGPNTFIRSFENSDINIGSNVVGEIPTTDGNGANLEYLIKSNTNYRVGTIMTVWDGSSVQYAEITTMDLGNTSGIQLSVDINAGKVRLIATSDIIGYTVKVLAKIQ
jgi:hypothetical protein